MIDELVEALEEEEAISSICPLDCKECSLSSVRMNVVHSYIPINTEILFLEEYPGEEENLEGGYVLTGKEGKFLKECINIGTMEFNYDKSLFGYMSVVKCRPLIKEGEERGVLKPTEVNTCKKYFEEEISELKNLKVIVCLGVNVLNWLTGKLGITMIGLSEYVISYNKYKVQLLTTYHPSFFITHKELDFRQKNYYRTCIIETVQKSIRLVNQSHSFMEHTSYVCNSLKKVRWLFTELSKQEIVAWDIETDSLDYLDANILCHSFSWKEGTGAVLPLLHQYSQFYWNKEEWEEIFSLLKSFLENPNIKKIAHNGKFDCQHCRSHGIEVQGFYADTMLMHYLVNENIDHNLKLLSWLYTDYGGYEEELKILMKEYSKKEEVSVKQASYNILPSEVLWSYATKDTDVTLQVYNKLLPILKAESTLDIFLDLYMPFIKLVTDIEYRGVCIDRKYLEETIQVFKDRITELNEKILMDSAVKLFIKNKKQEFINLREKKWNASSTLQKRYSREEYCNKGIEDIKFNYGSTKQLKELLVDQLKLRPIRKTEKGNASFDAKSLEYFAAKVDVAKLISEVNKTSNLLNTFLEGIELRIRKDGRIHTSLNVHVADTGRLSSSDPNLQNIPNKTKNPVDAKLIRDIFIADSEDHLIVEYDLKQAEFRMWCQLSQDPDMRRDLLEGLDIHTEIASRGFNVSKEKVSKEQREGAKGIVFGKMFGRGNKSVALELGISLSDAINIEKILFSKYKVASSWLKHSVERAKKNKYVQNCFGFRRHLKGLIDNPDSSIRAAAERLAVNSPIQGGASQMVCYAMLKVNELFKQYDIQGRILFPIHDAIVFNIHKKDLVRSIPLIEESMNHPHPIINVPLGIDGKIGYRWGSTIDTKEFLSTYN